MNFLLGVLGGMSVSNTTPLVLKSRFSMKNLKCNNKHCNHKNQCNTVCKLEMLIEAF